MWRGISLANKCLLLFGGVIVAIVLAGMIVPWVRLDRLLEDGLRQTAERDLSVWLQADPAVRESLPFSVTLSSEVSGAPAGSVFESSWDGTTRAFSLTRTLPDGRVAVLEGRSAVLTQLLAMNLALLLASGGAIAALAIATFYFITHKMILLPVRDLRFIAERVARGDRSVRSDIRTGDEFEELSRAFNDMLEKRLASEEKLRRSKRALDVKVDELSSANLALADAARIKGEFVANVSHELRTPLNSILGFADLLAEIAEREAASGDDSQKLKQRQRYLENIRRGGQSLLELIDAMLDLAKLESGRIEISQDRVDLVDLCERIVGVLEPIAAREGVTLGFDPGAASHARGIEVATDRGRVQQILFNLLSNGVKYAPLGIESPRVDVRVERLADAARVCVIDNGPGIPADAIERIFEKFERLDHAETRDRDGVGLGLAIARELAFVVQGEILVQSEEGQGSMFSLVLPLEPDPTRTEELKLESRFRADLAKQTREETSAG